MKGGGEDIWVWDGDILRALLYGYCNWPFLDFGFDRYLQGDAGNCMRQAHAHCHNHLYSAVIVAPLCRASGVCQ